MCLISICVAVFVGDSSPLLLSSISCPNVLICRYVLSLPDAEGYLTCRPDEWSYPEHSRTYSFVNICCHHSVSTSECIPGSQGRCPFVFIRWGLPFPKWLYQCAVPPSPCSPSSRMFDILSLFCLSHSEGEPLVVWIRTSLMSNGTENYVLCLLSIPMCFSDVAVQLAAMFIVALVYKLQMLFVLYILNITSSPNVHSEHFLQNTVWLFIWKLKFWLYLTIYF